MNIKLHQSKFDFSNWINKTAFEKSSKPAQIEHQYYFDLIFTLGQVLFPDLQKNKQLNQTSCSFDLNGDSFNIQKTYLDWLTLCSYFNSVFRKINLMFSFTSKGEIPNKYFYCTLYFNSILDEQVHTISFSLFGENVFNDDTPAAGGGRAIEQLDIKQQDLQKLLKLTKEKVMLMAKPVQQQSTKTSPTIQTIQPTKSPIFVDKTLQLIDTKIKIITESISKHNPKLSSSHNLAVAVSKVVDVKDTTTLAKIISTNSALKKDHENTTKNLKHNISNDQPQPKQESPERKPKRKRALLYRG